MASNKVQGKGDARVKPENEIISFSEDTASKTGMSSRTIQQEVQISNNLSSEIKENHRKSPKR